MDRQQRDGRNAGLGYSRRFEKSLISSGTLERERGEDSFTLQNLYFPFKLTATISALKIVEGCLLIGLGAAALVKYASYSGHASGIWGGVIVVISGVLGAYSVRTNAIRVYVILFLLASMISLLSSVFVIIYSGTGLSKDAKKPYSKELKSDEIAESVSSRESVLLINTLLILLAALDIIFSIPSIVICLRELCDCYYTRNVPLSPGGRDWLGTWLSQQNQVFYNKPGNYDKLRGSTYNHPPPFIYVPPDNHDKIRYRTRSKSPKSKLSGTGPNHCKVHDPDKMKSYPQVPFPYYAAAPLEYFNPYYFPPGPSYASSVPFSSNVSYKPPPTPAFPRQVLGYPHGYMVGGGLQPPNWYYPPEWDPSYQLHQDHQPRREKRKRHNTRDQKRSRSRSKSINKDLDNKSPSRGLTDSDLERTYTGMDRDLAEEFIDQTMDNPNSTVNVDTRDTTVSEEW